MNEELSESSESGTRKGYLEYLKLEDGSKVYSDNKDFPQMKDDWEKNKPHTKKWSWILEKIIENEKA